MGGLGPLVRKGLGVGVDKELWGWGQQDMLGRADPGFLEGGFKSIKRGFVFNILPDFSYISP